MVTFGISVVSQHPSEQANVAVCEETGQDNSLESVPIKLVRDPVMNAKSSNETALVDPINQDFASWVAMKPNFPGLKGTVDGDLLELQKCSHLEDKEKDSLIQSEELQEHLSLATLRDMTIH